MPWPSQLINIPPKKHDGISEIDRRDNLSREIGRAGTARSTGIRRIYLLLITYYLLLITYYLFLITYYLLLITYYLLLITYYYYITITNGKSYTSTVRSPAVVCILCTKRNTTKKEIVNHLNLKKLGGCHPSGNTFNLLENQKTTKHKNCCVCFLNL